MERNINSLIGFGIEATDGIIGEVEDFYFDDETWKIRYLIVKTGNWLSGRKVLISMGAIIKKYQLNELIPVNLTKKQVKESPDIDTEKPVSRQQEIKLFEHYAWESYWLSGFYPGGYLGVSIPFPTLDEKAPTAGQTAEDTHLRSMKKITGIHVHATDGTIGYINDFIVDDLTWQVLSLVVDTHNWIGGKKLIVEISCVHSISFSNPGVTLGISTAAVEDSKVYKEAAYSLHEPPIIRC